MMLRYNSTRVEREKAAEATGQWPSLVFGLFAIVVAGLVCIKDFQTRELPMADQTAVKQPDQVTFMVPPTSNRKQAKETGTDLSIFVSQHRKKSDQSKALQSNNYVLPKT